MAEELKTNNMNRGAKGSAFKLKSGNTTPFKMMGSSPMKQTTDPKKKELTTKSWIEADVEYRDVKKSKREDLAANLSKRYGTEITKKTDPKTGVKTWSNPEGVSVADLEEKLLVRTKKENIEGKLRN